MRASVYVGRVGGLAVALGIGATTGGLGVAWASPADTSGSSAGVDSSASSASGAPGPGVRSRGGRTARSVTATSVGQSRGGNAMPAPAGNASPTPAAVPSTPKLTLPSVQSVDAPKFDIPAQPTATNFTQPAVAPPPTSMRASPAVLAPAADVPQMIATHAPAAAAGSMESVWSPLLGSGQGAPVESPMSWAVVGAARRDPIAPTRTTRAPAAAFSTGEVLDQTPLPSVAEGGSPSASLTANAEQATPSFGEILSYTFFNRSPSASPAQVPGQSVNGVVTGNLNARGTNGATMDYTVTNAPASGDVVINPDGTYIYTPNLAAALSGVTDSFSVTVDNGTAYRLTGIGGVIQGFFSSIAQLIGLRQPDAITVQVPVTVVPAIVKIPVGTKPFGIVVSPDGRWIYTANYGDNTVSVVDAANAIVARTFTVGPESCGGLCEGPFAVTLSPDGSRLYASGGTTPVFKPDGSLDYFEGKTPITEIDTGSGIVVNRYDLGWGTGGANLAASPDGTKIYSGLNSWALGQPDGVKVLDLATGTTSYLGVISIVVAPSPDGNAVTLVDWRNDGAVYSFDVATNTQLWSTRLGSPNSYYYGRSVATGENGRVYVTYRGSSSRGPTGVAVLDAATGAVIATLQTGTTAGYEDSYQGIAVSPDGKRVYAVDPNAATLSSIDAATNTLIATTPLGGGAGGVAVSPDSKYVYVTNRLDGTLSVIPVG